MTAEEKAKDIKRKFKERGWSVNRCAEICVNEIEDAIQRIPDMDCEGNIILDKILYWREVGKQLKQDK